MLTFVAASIISCSSLTVVDGDTVKCDGVNMRPMGPGAPFASGFDTPEIGRAKCDAERAKGIAAKTRLRQLLSSREFKIEHSGEFDKWERPLIWIRFENGETAGEVLMKEGFAVEWTPSYEPNWC